MPLLFPSYFSILLCALCSSHRLSRDKVPNFWNTTHLISTVCKAYRKFPHPSPSFPHLLPFLLPSPSPYSYSLHLGTQPSQTPGPGGVYLVVCQLNINPGSLALLTPRKTPRFPPSPDTPLHLHHLPLQYPP